MKKKPVVAKFKILIGKFYSYCMTKLSFMERDLEQFNKFGVTQTHLDDFRDNLTIFNNLPTDEELLGAQRIATDAKDLKADELREAIADILNRVERKYGARSAQYRQFGTSKLSNSTNGELSYIASRVLRVATNIQLNLVDEGLTPEVLADFTLLIDQFNAALKVKEDAAANRELGTEKRLETANAIYETLVKNCDTGKRIWRSTSEARYNDYIIYDTPSGNDEPETPEETEEEDE